MGCLCSRGLIASVPGLEEMAGARCTLPPAVLLLHAACCPLSLPPAPRAVQGAGRSAGWTEHGWCCALCMELMAHKGICGTGWGRTLVIEFCCRFRAAEGRMYTAAAAAKRSPDPRGVSNPTASRERAPGMENPLQMHVKNVRQNI